MSTSSTPRDLRLLAGAVFVSAAGDFIALITLALLVHDLTGSGMAVSALFASTMVPVVVLAPAAGLLADRVESVRLLVIVSLASAAIAAGLAFSGDLATILALSALLAGCAAIGQPAEFALVPAAAAPGRLTEANGLIESARYAGFAAGPLVAGAVVAGAGVQAALLVNAASFVAIAAGAAMLRVRRHPLPSAGEGERKQRARDGIAYLWRDGVLRVTLLTATGALLFISASLTVEVFYAKDVLHAGDAGYAVLTAVWLGAMVVGATAVAQRIPVAVAAGAALVALGIQGAGIAAQTAWAVLPFAMAGYLVGGLGHGVKNTLMRTTIQRRVPAALHGRAFAAYNAARNTAELGAIGAGGLLVGAIGPADGAVGRRARACRGQRARTAYPATLGRPVALPRRKGTRWTSSFRPTPTPPAASTSCPSYGTASPSSCARGSGSRRSERRSWICPRTTRRGPTTRAIAASRSSTWP